jgi:site-specific DNA-methyltransferase (adenine-specific)
MTVFRTDKLHATFTKGDSNAVLDKVMPDSFDSCVTDPPYHLKSIVARFGGKDAAPAQHGTDGAYARASKGFMGQTWDGGDIAQDPAFWSKVYRALKPGAHLVAFGGSRTFHRMAVAIEDAGFELRDTLMWLYGTGFPKSHSVQKDLAKQKHADADLWEGWGTALKPAFEPIVLARKPLSEKTVAANVLRWGTGAINIDVCRVPTTDSLGGGNESADSIGQFTNEGWRRPWMDDPTAKAEFAAKVRGNVEKAEALGRFPANILHDGTDEVTRTFPNTDPSTKGKPRSAKAGKGWGMTATGAEYSDAGSAARFFYSAKANKTDRAGSDHPTVKPVALMRYVSRLITPPRGTILEPFAGSGTTAQAALEEGFNSFSIEREDKYFAACENRIGNWVDDWCLNAA